MVPNANPIIRNVAMNVVIVLCIVSCHLNIVVSPLLPMMIKSDPWQSEHISGTIKLQHHPFASSTSSESCLDVLDHEMVRSHVGPAMLNSVQCINSHNIRSSSTLPFELCSGVYGREKQSSSMLSLCFNRNN